MRWAWCSLTAAIFCRRVKKQLANTSKPFHTVHMTETYFNIKKPHFTIMLSKLTFKCFCAIFFRRIEVWPGFFTSLSAYDGGNLMLQVDVTFRLLRTETVLDFISNLLYVQHTHYCTTCIYYSLRFCFSYFSNNPSAKQTRNYQEMIQKELLGASVMTRYNNKCYRIDDIDFKASPRDTFENLRGRISYVEYYK